MSEWKEYKLADLCTKIGSGATPRGGGESYKETGISLIRSQNVLDFQFSYSGLAFIDDEQADDLKNVIVRENDVLLNITGDSVARVCKVPKKVIPARVNQHVAIIRSDEERLNSDFLLYYLLKLKEHLLSISEIGATRRAITKGMIENLEISIPEITEQTAIASVLSRLDDKIDLLHRQNVTLEKIAETLFRQWFVEEAKEDWKNGKVSDLIKIQSGFAFKSTSFVETGKYRLITIKGVQDGYLELNNADQIEELPDRMPDFCKLQIGDILLSLTGNVGRCCVVDTNDLLLNQRVAKLHPIQERDRAFSYFLFRQPQVKQLLEEMGKGTAQSNLSPIETSNMELQVPDEDKLSEFSAIATTWLNKLLFNKKSIQTLSQLRDSLLPKLMNGEVTINTN